MPSGFTHGDDTAEKGESVMMTQQSVAAAGEEERERHQGEEGECDAASGPSTSAEDLSSLSNEEEEFEYENCLGDYIDDEEDTENLNPLTTLIRLANSNDFHDGEVVIRSLHETLQYVIDSPKDIKTVLDVITSLSTNNEPTLRTDLMEQVPQIAFLCHDNPEKLNGMVSGTLVPMVVKYLTDESDLVRKTSQAALLVLLEQELVSHKDVQEQVCPVVLDLTGSDAVDFLKIEAVALMSKMAPLVGCEMTEQYFLQRFTRLCSDSLFQVRKVCAANFGELSGIVGTRGTENYLLPYFLNLCEDGVWGIRKACADVFMVVSCACSLDTRKNRLAPLFVSLLSDDSRWVRLAAFQNLGPFISTFADPNVTGLHYNEEGILFIGSPPEGRREHLNQSIDVDSIIKGENKCERSDLTAQHENFIKIVDNHSYEENRQNLCGTYDRNYEEERKTSVVDESYSGNILESENENLGLHFDSSPFSNDDNTKPAAENVSDLPSVEEASKPDDDPSYNELNYWRIPLPEIEFDSLLEVDLENCGSSVVILEEKDSSCGGSIKNPKVSDVEQEIILELRNYDKSEKDGDDYIDDVESVDKEKTCEEDTKRVEMEEESNHPSQHKDDDQAELESLAASLAESIFCNDPKSDSNNYERIESKLCDHLHNHVISAVSSQNSHWSHTVENEMKLSSDVLNTSYTEYCSSDSQRTPSVDDGDKMSEKGSNSYNENHKEHDSSDLLSSTYGESEYKKETRDQEDYSWDSRDYHSTRSLRNRSFSNLSVLTGPRLLVDGETERVVVHDWVALREEVKEKILSQGREKPMRRKRDSFYSDININQDIVPKSLLEHYISMTHPMRAEQVDDEITRHCAYSLPAVALTLGRRYWSVLRETYEKLSKDMHWKVRRTLAFSIHELALILGEELAQKDLLPVFEGLIKDLDEVRIGVLKHLAHFLKMLPPSQRKLFLPRLSEFLTPDNVNNWRFRLELALQLAPISELFTPEECSKHICPITFDLMADKVVEIRRTCFVVVSQLARQLMDDEGSSFIVPYSNKLIEEFAQADTWTKRQSFAYVVGQIIKDSSIPLPVVYSLLMPKFLELANDRVANIRLVVARIINTIILTRDCADPDVLDKIRETLFVLQRDIDRDVQYFASMSSNTNIMEGQDTNFY